MRDLSLNDLLRYGFAGGNFLLFFYLQFQPAIDFAGEFSKSAAILAASLLIGSILYVIHRALPFPLFLLPVALWLSGYKQGTGQWDQDRAETLAKDEVLRNTSSEWGAQVHFLYVLFWSTALVPVAGYSLTDFVAVLSSWKILVVAGSYFVAALVHNIRLARFTRVRIECCR